MRSNRWEREMWRVWRPVFGWENLCPVLFADPFGVFVVMPRAQPIITDDVAHRDYYPDITAEAKREDYGIVGDQVLALDYGLWDADAIAERRSYYSSKASEFGA
jgi:hypothetical protein